MSGKIELHYSPNFPDLANNFLQYHPEFLKRPNSFLYLTPNLNRAAFLRKKYILDRGHSELYQNTFQSYPGFFLSLFDKLNIPGKYIDFNLRCLALQQIIIRYSDRLQYLSYPNGDFPPEIVQELQKLFDDIRTGAGEKQILAFAEERLHLSARDKFLNDLKFIFRKYLRLIDEDYPDETGIKKSVCKHISAAFLKKHFPEISSVIIEDVSHLRHYDFQFIELLRKLDLQLFLLLPYGRNNEIFIHKTQLFNRLKTMAEHVQGYHTNDRLSNSLFQIKSERLDFSEKIRLYAAVDKQKEVEQVAGEIKKLVVDQSIRFSRIAVSSPRLENYRPVIETIFSRYQIPHTFVTGKNIGNSLVIKNLLLLIDLVREDYPAEIFLALLKSPYFLYGRNLNSAQVDSIFASLRVKSGKKEIVGYLEREMNFARERIEDEDDEHRLEYEGVIAAIKSIVGEASYLEKSRSANEIYTFFVRLVKQHKIVQTITDEPAGVHITSAEETIQALNRFFQALFFWKVISGKLSSDQKYTLSDLTQVLSLVTSVEKLNPSRPKNLGVQIVPLANLNDQSYEAVFIVGMEEGALPGYNPENRLSLQPDLRELEPFLKQDKLYQERELFLQILHSPVKSLQLSYPRFNQDNPVLPSIFLRELERISIEPAKPASNIPLYTESDLLADLFSTRTVPGERKKILEKLQKALRTFVQPGNIDHLNYRLKILDQRMRLQGSTIYEGDLSEDNIIVSWLNDYYRRARFSPTQLERYAFCPMIFFFEKILYAELEEELEEYLSPLDRGIAIHNILFRFYRTLPERERTLEALISIAEKELEKIPAPRSILWDMEKNFYMGSTEHAGLLGKFFEYEKETLQQYSTIPRYFEFSFGNPKQTPDDSDPVSASRPFLVERGPDSYQFKGKIDRIEIADDGTMLVVDYKTGSVPTIRQMWEGEKLQLPIYLAAAEQLLSSIHKRLRPAGGAFYQIKSEQDLGKKIVFKETTSEIGPVKVSKSAQLPNDKYVENGKSLDLNRFLERSISFAIDYIHGIRAGQFKHTADESRCKRWDGKACDFLPLCRVNWEKQRALANQENHD
jgi:ATP-dependent helicase/DNAse subunit B